VKTFGLAVGDRFPEIAPDVAARIEQCDRSIVKHEAFWVERLADLQPLTMPYARRSLLPANQQQYVSVKMPIPDEAISFLKKRHPSWKVGDFIFAAVVGYLARIGGADCFDFGLRDVELERELAGTGGLFADCVPCHLEVDFHQSFAAFFEAVRIQVATTTQHKTYLRDIVGRYPVLRSVPELGSEQLFSVAIDRVEKLADRQVSLGRDLTFVIAADGRECVWVYNTETLTGESITKTIEQFIIFLHGIVTDASQQLAYLPLLAAAERHKMLVEWNNTAIDYPHDRCIHQLFEEQVKIAPEAIAVICEGRELTYRELNHRANQLAHYLQKLGLKPDGLVGICLVRSLETIVALLGVLKAGGAYVPLDPTYPQERLSWTIADAEISILLTHVDWIDICSTPLAHTVFLDRDWSEIARQSDRDPICAATPEHLAYLIYTSGSTGTPKGVMVQHNSVVHFSRSAVSEYRLVASDRVLQFASIDFDAAVEEIYPCLISGGTLVLRTDRMLDSVSQFFAACRNWQISVLDLPTAYWHQLVTELATGSVKIPPSLRLVLIGGERVLLESIDIWQSCVGAYPQLINTYGPTEGTVVATTYPIDSSDPIRGLVPIGTF
jgi:amino acid adenylation domain-containing protein